MKKLLFLLPVAVWLLFSCSKDDPEIIEKIIYQDRTDTLYLDTVIIQFDTIPLYDTLTIHDTLKIYKTDTILLSQDDRTISNDVRVFLRDNWMYIRERMNTNFNTDKAERVFMFYGKSYLHLSSTFDKDGERITLLSIDATGKINNVVYFIIGENDYGEFGWKYYFNSDFSQMNSYFFSSLLLGVFTKVPSLNPF